MIRPKFRVWDKEEQKWYVPTYKAYKKELHDIDINLDGSLSIRTFDESGKYVTIHESMFEGRYELLQSTGLFDKNGTEIYEGDILGVPVAIDTKTLNCEVVFEDGIFGIKDSLDGWGFQIGLVPLIEIILAKKVIIIGNKFEHPHLLGEE